MKNKFLLRVGSGKFRGKGIQSPEDFSVRPTTGRVKGSLFDIIRNDVINADFLDVFSGTGQIGIEAISNGCRHATFIDENITLTKTNIQLVGCGEFATALCGDFRKELPSLKDNSFDIIFADPPYREGLYEDILSYAHRLLKENGMLILEHASDITVPQNELYKIKSTRAYGSRAFTFLTVSER